MNEKKPLEPIPPFEFPIDCERLMSVAQALGEGDISECKTDDVKHTVELLVRLDFVENLVPGLLSNMLSVLIPHYLGKKREAMLLELALGDAKKHGLVDEFQSVVDAARNRKKADLVQRLVDYHMKAYGMSQAEAIRLASEHYGREEESVRRSVTRSKKRAQK